MRRTKVNALVAGLLLAVAGLLWAQDPGVQNIGKIMTGDAGVFAGSVGFENATSGSITLAPQTGALGTRAQTLLANDGALAPGMTIDAIFCGDLANNTTTYLGAASGFAAGTLYASGLTANDVSFAQAGAGCSALDSTTEATADTVLWTNNALRPLGMVCSTSSSGTNGVTFNLRDDAASLSPDVAVTIATSNTTGAVAPAQPPTIAAGSALAIRHVAQGEDLSAQDAWCVVKFLVVP